MSFSYADFASALKAGARISAEDVLAVRRWAWPDGAISDAEAEAVFEINRLAREAEPEWTDFFVEAMTEYVVNARPPTGYVDEALAAWLIDQVERDGAPVTAIELALVVRIVEKTLNAPAALKSWALRQIEESVARDGRVGEDEAALLRRLIFAAGGEGALIVGADEAETLWRLKESCRNADNASGWKTLFVQALGNHLMAYSSYAPLERAEAARLEAFVDDHRSSVLGFFARMRGANPLTEAKGLLDGQEPEPDHDATVAAANAITPQENDWLRARIDADGTLDDYEEALLAFVAGDEGR
ncbi:MAG: hypothetical protein ACT4N8_00070 [Sphingosinicella sp.]|uniref:hypothetical protein n=1 Tax=Sphingosinicella sp. TaxID=1917971 RepID=UPI0040384486